MLRNKFFINLEGLCGMGERGSTPSKSHVWEVKNNGMPIYSA